MILAIRIEAVTVERRSAARAEVKRWIADLERVGVSVHKISVMLHRQHNTVKNWKLSGRIEKCDGDMLEAMHAEYCKELTTPITHTQPPKESDLLLI